MLLADAPPESLLQVAALVVTAVVGAWVTVRVHRIDQQAKRSRRRAAEERKRCEAVELRVVELEKALTACLERHQPRRANPRPKR